MIASGIGILCQFLTNQSNHILFLQPTKLLTSSSVKPVDQNKPLAVPGKRKHSGDKVTYSSLSEPSNVKQ